MDPVAHVDGAAAGALPSLLVFTAALAVWLVTAVRARFVLGTDESLRRLRRLIALPAAAFAVTYAARVWGPVALGGSDGRALFAALTDAFSHPVPAWLLAFGAAFGALQLEQSLRVLGETFGFPRRARLALWYRGFAIVFSVVLKGSTVVSGSADKTVKVWDLETGQCVHTLEEQ